MISIPHHSSLHTFVMYSIAAASPFFILLPHSARKIQRATPAVLGFATMICITTSKDRDIQKSEEVAQYAYRGIQRRMGVGQYAYEETLGKGKRPRRTNMFSMLTSSRTTAVALVPGQAPNRRFQGKHLTETSIPLPQPATHQQPNYTVALPTWGSHCSMSV